MEIRKLPLPQKREHLDLPMSDREWLRKMEDRRSVAEKQEASARTMRETAHEMHDAAVEMVRRSRLFLP